MRMLAKSSRLVRCEGSVNDNPGNACFVRDELRTAADTSNTFYGAFIQDEIALTDRLELMLGLRYDKFDREIDFDVIGAQPVDCWRASLRICSTVLAPATC